MAKKLVLLLCFFQGICAQNTPRIIVHAFVHGTRLSGLGIFSAIPLLNNNVQDKHLYTRSVKSARKDPAFFDAQVMQEEGLVEISAETIQLCRTHKLPTEKSKRGAIQVIAAYDQFTPKNNVTNLYYTYGWSGMLDAQYRQKEAKTFYEKLVELRDQLHKKYPLSSIDFVLHGHSHGGNLILNLAAHENEQKKQLVIDCTILYGTPIQVETADYANHAMFKTIINLFSNNDHIQVTDSISTQQESQRVLAPYVHVKNTKAKYVVDACVCLNGNPGAFGHACFFYIDDVVYNQNAEFAAIRPLPLVTFGSIIQQLVHQAQLKRVNHHLHVNVMTADGCSIGVFDQYKNLAISDNLVSQLALVKATLEKTWTPYARRGHIQGALRGLGHTLKEAPTTIYQNYINPLFQ